MIDQNREKQVVQMFVDETLEDLQRNGLRLLQKKDGFRFGEDAVLLAHFAAKRWNEVTHSSSRFVELGSHSGIVSILLTALIEDSEGVGIELIPRQVELMRRNISLNRLHNRLATIQGDIRTLSNAAGQLPTEIGVGTLDFVVCNPPYGVPGRGVSRNIETEFDFENQVAREEVACDFDDICRLAAKLLRAKGRFYFCHRPERFPELIQSLLRFQLMPIELMLIAPRQIESPTLVLFTAIRLGNPGGFRFLKPLVVRDEQSNYTPEMLAFVGGGDPYRPSEEDVEVQRVNRVRSDREEFR